MLYKIIYAVLIIIGYAAWYILGRITGKRIGKRLGFREGVEAVKIVHNEAAEVDRNFCQKELEGVFAELESCVDYIEEQLDEVPDCFDALKRDIEHIKFQTLGECGFVGDKNFFKFLIDEREEADGSIGGEVR